MSALSPEATAFLEAVRARYGYDFLSYSPASMGRRVRAALAKSGATSLSVLQARVLGDPHAFTQLVDDLTVRVSELFRDPDLFALLREKVMPALKTWPQLKVWHCGCAGGEEVYAHAILLREAGLYERTQIYATDLSEAALDRARDGVWPQESFARFAEAYRLSGGVEDPAQYCVEAYGGIAISESLKRNVLFFQHDLGADHAFGEMHVVFCRNVLIYFGRELRGRVLAKLRQSVSPGGYLCLGAAERLSTAERDGAFTVLQAPHPLYRYET